MKRKVIITYEWWRDDHEPIVVEHSEALEESAMVHINDMMKDGYTSGDLNDNIKMTDDDPENGISYSGWFSINTTNEDDSAAEYCVPELEPKEPELEYPQ